MESIAIKRIQSELKQVQSKGTEIQEFEVLPVRDLLRIECKVFGPNKTIYEGRILNITIVYPTTYPRDSPEIFIKPSIYHANIVEKNGTVMLPILSAENWRTDSNIQQIIHYLCLILQEPAEDCFAATEAANEYKINRAVYVKKASESASKLSKA